MTTVAGSRRARRGVLSQILPVGLLGLLAALVVGSVAAWNVTRMRDANAELERMQGLGDHVQALRADRAGGTEEGDGALRCHVVHCDGRVRQSPTDAANACPYAHHRFRSLKLSTSESKR